MPSEGAAKKYTDTLQALKEANEKEERIKASLEEKKKAALSKAAEPVIDVPPVVYPPLGNAYFPQAKEVEAQKAAAAEAAQAEAKIAAEVDAEMNATATAGMPVSSTRKLLEKQYRKEMKMRMANDMTVGDSLYNQMYTDAPVPVPLTPAEMDMARIEAMEAAGRADAEARSMAAMDQHRRFAEAEHQAMMMGMAAQANAMVPPGMPLVPPGVPPPAGISALAEAREHSMRLQNQLRDDAKSSGAPQQ
jgi:hypothetical protein